MLLFVEYPKCSTCQKAKKWLTDQGLEFQDRHIVEENPKKEELETWYKESGLPLKRFFNTSGNKYKELHLKDRLPSMTEEEQLELFSHRRNAGKAPRLGWSGLCSYRLQRKRMERKTGTL